MAKMKAYAISRAEQELIDKLGMTPEQYIKAVDTYRLPVHVGMTMTSFNPNEDPAWAMPLSGLVNMWRVRYGDTWIDVSEIEDEFWLSASSRLHRNKKMEEAETHDDNTPWARLREDA
jgi:hypothetical protein